jgi:hypothetical protein
VMYTHIEVISCTSTKLKIESKVRIQKK